MRELLPGLYGPLPTFFDDDQELDLVSYKKHLTSKCPASISDEIPRLIEYLAVRLGNQRHRSVFRRKT